MQRCTLLISTLYKLTVSSFCVPVRLKMAAGKAQIGKLAPDFTAKAVMPDGEFKDVTLSSYRGAANPLFSAHQKVFEVHLLRVFPHCELKAFIYTTKDCNELACFTIHVWWIVSSVTPMLQGNTLFFSSILWTSPLCVPLRSLPSVTLPRSSGKLVVRSLRHQLIHTSPILRGNYMTRHFQHYKLYLQAGVQEMILTFLLFKDKHTKKTGWPWSNEDTPCVRHQAHHLHRLWCPKGGWRNCLQVGIITWHGLKLLWVCEY